MPTELKNQVAIRIPGLTSRQCQMLEHSARILHIGCGTKTGKSVACACWIAQGILAGERTSWIAPWYSRTRASFETIRSILSPLIESGELQASETTLRIRGANGGGLDCFSGDNYQGVYGGNFSRVVVDEASRCPSGVWPAVLTTISGTNGKVRAAFNLELGSKNWAVRNLLRVQVMTPEERKRSSEDFLMFPTGGDAGDRLVDPALIEMLRWQIPEPLWRALYLAEVPIEDVTLFRNLDKIFTGFELAGPAEGGQYVAGVDLGRKQDWTVVTVIDSASGAVVASDRFHELSWTVQVARCATLYKEFRCQKAWVDATGVGDPVVEELQKSGLDVEPFIFTAPSRKALLEQLIVACDRGEITLPANERFLFYKHELESFEYQLDGITVKYAAPPSFHDDCVMSLALAVHGFKKGALGGIFMFYKERAERIRSGEVESDAAKVASADAERQAQTTAGWGGRKFGRAFGENVNEITPARTVQKVAAPQAPKCPECGNVNLTRCGVQGISGDIEESCGACGKYRRVIPRKVVSMRG